MKKWIIGMSLVWLSLTVNAQGIDFRALSYQEAIEAAEAEGKPIFMDCYTTWCGPCKWMSANIFPQKEMGDYFNENFVCVKFDMEKGEGLEIAKEFKVRAYPTLLYISPDRQLLNVQVGASQEVADYLENGAIALNPKANMPYLKSHKAEHLDDPAFMRQYFALFGEANRLEEDEVKTYLAQFRVEAWGSDDNWAIIEAHLRDPERESFKKLIDNEALLTSLQGEAVPEYMEQVLFYTLARKRARARTEEAIAAYEAERDQLLSKHAFSRSDALQFQLGLFELERSQDWEGFCALSLDKVQKYSWDDANQLNGIAWNIFEHSDKAEQLRKAEQIAARAVALDRQHHILDTQANLLFKLGKYEEALSLEKEALALALKRGEDGSNYEKVIAEIKAAQEG